MSILTGLVPPQVPDDCNDVKQVDCGEGVVGSPSGQFEIIFPSEAGSTLPLSGGAVVKIDISALDLNVSQSVENIVTRNLRVLENLNLVNDAKLDSLISARNAINESLIKFQNVKIESSGRNRSAPDLYISVYRGDTNSLDPEVANPDMVRICNFRFIPTIALTRIIELIAPPESEFESVVGSSGRSFQFLRETSSRLNNDNDLVELLTEIFPIFNISGDEIVKKSGNPVLGGFYTIHDGHAYIKMPDLSGKDSGGYSNDDLGDDELSLFFELSLEGDFVRTEIEDYLSPPVAVISETDFEFPSVGTLEIEVETDLGSGDISAAYLSLVADSQSVSDKDRGINKFSNNIELFTIPVLTKTDFVQSNFGGTINNTTSSLGLISSSLNRHYSDLTPEFIFNLSISELEDLGVPFAGGNIPSSNLFGERNRPELLLSDGTKNTSVRSNDRKYFRPQSYGAIKALVSNRPKFYEHIPSRWISSSDINDSETGLVLTFRASSFENINLAGLNGQPRFHLYLRDSLGQISKVSGRNISLSAAVPSVSEVTPNGFSGGPRLQIDELLGRELVLVGENLENIERIDFIAEAASVELSVEDDRIGIISDENFLSISFDSPLEEFGFVGDLIYEVSVISTLGTVSLPAQVFLSADEKTVQPGLVSSPVRFRENEFFAEKFSGPITGVPILSDGNNAKVGIKSRSKLFTGEHDLFAYLAFRNNSAGRRAARQLALPVEIVEITNFDSEGSVIIPKSIEYVFSKSFVGSDFYRVTNRKANLQLPGFKYAGFNFDGLLEVDEAFIFITSQSLGSIVGSATQATLESDQFGVIEVGDPDAGLPPFIAPPQIIGLVADLPGSSEALSTLTSDRLGDDISDLFSKRILSSSSINAFEKISRLAIIFSGVDEPFLRKRYDFRLGTENIKDQLSRQIIPRDNGEELIAVFDNISTIQEGVLPIIIEKRDRLFDFTATISSVSSKASFIIESGSYSLDEQTGVVTVNTTVSQAVSSEEDPISSGLQSAFLGAERASDPNNTMEILIPQIGSGVLINQAESQGDFYKLFAPATISPTVDLVFNTVEGGDSSDFTKVFSGFTSDSFSLISKLVLQIPSGALVRNYSIDDSGTLLGSLTARINNPAAIQFNVPEVFEIGRKNAVSFSPIDASDITLKSGEDIELRVRNTKRNFVFKFNNISVNPKGRPTPVANAPKGTYQATVTIPPALSGIQINPQTGNCFEVCASGSNATRKSAKIALGTQFVVDLDQKMDDLLFGPLKDKIPDVEGLKEKLEDFALRFVSFEFANSLVPKDLIDSFCDFSFHLTAELKFALNGFQSLMIPIQVIFCIIDVICALLNPVKVARAVIRLFECLYDLVLLLPVISIPVMFLQLILHLLELLECVIEKILFLITAINELIRALDRAITDKNWAAIKALEEVISEYLFEIEADLSFLEPIISILAIFLELLQLAFRFPCQVDPGGGDPACGLDGTLLAGIVGGIVAPGDDIVPSALIPVAQPFTNESIDDAVTSGNGSDPLEEPAAGDEVAFEEEDTTYLDSMQVDLDTLRASNSELDFEATFAPSFTKSRKGIGGPTLVEFQFKERGRNGVFRQNKIIDPDQTLDAPLSLLSESGTSLQISSGKGNFVSPLDGETFMTISGDKGTIKPLVLTFELPILEINEETGLIEETGTETVTRTFDDIPSMAILDEEFNLYFIEENGVEFDNDDNVKSIRARMVNNVSAPKFKLSKEDQEVDTDGDGTEDDEAPVFDFPQLYFVDMRQAHEQIQQACYTSSINSFLLDEDNTEEIENTVEEAQDCLNEWLVELRAQLSDVRTALNNGELPGLIDVEAFETSNQELRDCLGGTADNMCRFVVNTLNTSFQVLEDSDTTPLESFPDTSLTEEVLEDFAPDTPALTGAREFAAGIGDSATIGIGKTATVSLIPRDSYDLEVKGDFTNRVIFEIISDTTGSARFIPNDDGNVVTRTGTEYTALLTASRPGEVKIRAKVCDRTIQAVTFDGISSSLDLGDQEVIDCIPDTASELSGSSPPLGALIKIDRILTVFFIREATVALVDPTDDAGQAKSTPQEFGTSLEN